MEEFEIREAIKNCKNELNLFIKKWDFNIEKIKKNIDTFEDIGEKISDLLEAQLSSPDICWELVKICYFDYIDDLPNEVLWKSGCVLGLYIEDLIRGEI
jgi:hypothetical protein